MELYEAAVVMRGNTPQLPQELSTRYKSLVGGLIFPAPTTRIDGLFAVGMHARAMDCATEDMYNSALYTLSDLHGSNAYRRTDLRAWRDRWTQICALVR